MFFISDNRVLNINPKFAQAYNGKGLVYDKMGNFEKAL